ncbi:hypothetical protein BH09PLA1_BH09PLA1_07810 [soil metagenome]
MRSSHLVSCCLVASIAMLLAARGATAANIAINFTQNWTTIANWPGANAAEQATNQMRATNDVLQAKDNWEAAITDNFNMTVTVDWALPFAFGNNSSEVCGVGGVENSQIVGGVTKPLASRIIFNRTLQNWFFDPTPATHEEYDSVPNEPWRGTAKPNGPAKNKVDLVSCAKHELGHALGFLYGVGGLGGNGQFAPYIAEVADGDIDVNDFGGIALNVGALNMINSASHFSAIGNVPDPALLVAVPMKDLLMVPEAGPAGDERTVMSPYDVSAVAKILGLPLGIGYNLTPKGTVPEPAAASVALVAMCLLRSRRH